MIARAAAGCGAVCTPRAGRRAVAAGAYPARSRSTYHSKGGEDVGSTRRVRGGRTDLDVRVSRRPSVDTRLKQAARLSALVALGSALIAVELRLRGERHVDDQVVGQLVAFALFVPLAVLCWRGLGLGLLGLAVVCCLAVGLRAAAFEPSATPPLTTDLNRYAWDGRVQAAGINPYRYAPTDARLAFLRDPKIWPHINRKRWKTVYPPGAESAFLLARSVAGHGVRATTWLFLAGEALTVAFLVFVLGRRSLPLERVGIYALHPLAVSEIAANGHVDALVATAVAGLLAAWQARRFALAGVAIAAATLVKLWPVLLLAAFARSGGRRLVLSASGVIVAAYCWYLSVGFGVVGSLWMFEQRLRFGSLTPPFLTLVGRPTVHVVAGALVLAVLAGSALRDRLSTVDLARLALLLSGLVLILRDYLQPWYGVALLPLLVLVPQAFGWLWLTGTLPLLYLFADAKSGVLPVWIRLVVFAPLPVAGIYGVACRRRRKPTFLEQPPVSRIALVIPVLDEEAAIPALLAELPDGLLDEVVVVDGGSTDRTVELAEAAGARVVVESRRGYGRACAAGAAATMADVVVFMDGDGSDDPADLPALLAPILDGRAALSLGARIRAEDGALLPHQRFGNALVARLVWLLYGPRIRDVPPLRAIRRDALEELGLREMTYGWPTEMIVKTARRGLPIVEVEVRCRTRRGGSSKIAGRALPSARAGLLMLAVVFRNT